jgi:hypothetical protein
MILSRCDRILRILIRRSFPELRRSRIRLQTGDYDCWMYYEPAGRREFILGVDRSLESAPRRVLEGGFAHELAHIARDIRYSPSQLERAAARYAASAAWRARDERNTDLEAIRRGCGLQLLALMRWGRVRGYTSVREQGLLLSEVHRLLAQAPMASGKSDTISSCAVSS